MLMIYVSLIKVVKYKMCLFLHPLENEITIWNEKKDSDQTSLFTCQLKGKPFIFLK